MKNNQGNQQSNLQWSYPFRYTMGIILFIAVVAFLIYAREAVKMLIIAGFSAYLISPAVSFLTDKTKLTRTMAVNIVYFTAIIFLVVIPIGLTPVFFEEIQIVVKDLLDVTTEISDLLSTPIQFAGIEFHFEQLGDSIGHLQDNVLMPLPAEALEILEATTINILWFLIILVSVYLFMMEWPRIKEWMIHLAPEDYHNEVRELYNRLCNVWMAYLRGQIVLMIVVWVVFTIAWAIIGIPGALVLGVVAGLFTLIPDVGPTIAALLAVAVAVLEGSSWIQLSPVPSTNNLIVAGIVLVTYIVLINLKNALVRPIIMGRSLHMNEALIFIAILIATILAGIMGALLIVPLMASVSVVMEYLRRRILGLPPFADDGTKQFKVPEEKIKRKRGLRFKRKSSA